MLAAIISVSTMPSATAFTVMPLGESSRAIETVIAARNPLGGDGFGPGVEPQAVPSQDMQVAEEGLLVSGKGEKGQRHGDAHIDSDHAAIGMPDEFSGVVAALGEDGGAVGKGVGVHEPEPFLEIPDPLDAHHRPEDFLIADGHAGSNMVEDCGADKKSVLKALGCALAAVQNQRGPFGHALVDPVDHGLLVRGVDDRAELGGRIVGRADHQPLGHAFQDLYEAVGHGFLNHR